MIGVLTNLLAVPLSGPILTLGLVGSVLGNSHLRRAPSERLEWLPGNPARVDRPCSPRLPFATATTPGVTLLLVSLFYAGCVPAALCGSALPERPGAAVGNRARNVGGAVAPCWSVPAASNGSGSRRRGRYAVRKLIVSNNMSVDG